MKLLRGYRHAEPLKRASVITIGNFDGFHLGHQKIIQRLVKQAQAEHLNAVLVSFQPSAGEFFARRQAPARIYGLREKIQLAGAFGLDYLVCLKFDESLASMTATDFIRNILYDVLHVKKLVTGSDFKFGCRRQGDIQLLRAMGGQLDFEVKEVATMVDGAQRVSSSLIREKLAAGDFQKAARLLGRKFAVSGRVFHGEKRGRTLGFPTANILLRRPAAPIHGVFAVTAKCQGRAWQGVANVGKRPTFNGHRLQLEAHLFNCRENLYAQRLEVIFHAKLREEIQFPSVSALKRQITRDTRQARQYFSART